MLGIKNVDLLFYTIAIIGSIFLFGGLYLISISHSTSQQTSITSSALITHISPVPTVNKSLQSEGFDLFNAGFVIIFADIAWYEIYFRMKVLHKK